MSGPGRSAPDPAEQGHAGERTALAWRRTVLSAAVVALLAARLAVDSVRANPGPLALAAGLAGVLAWGGSAALVVLAYRRNGAGRRCRPAGRELPICALAAVGYAVLGVLLVLLSGH